MVDRARDVIQTQVMVAHAGRKLGQCAYVDGGRDGQLLPDLNLEAGWGCGWAAHARIGLTRCTEEFLLLPSNISFLLLEGRCKLWSELISLKRGLA